MGLILVVIFTACAVVLYAVGGWPVVVAAIIGALIGALIVNIPYHIFMWWWDRRD